MESRSDENIFDYGIYYRSFHDESDKCADDTALGLSREVKSFLPASLSCKVLDIGCGMGFMLLGLKLLGYQDIFGIDIDESQIDACKKRNLPVELVSDTLEFLKAHLINYDVIILRDVLEHIPVKDQIVFMRALNQSLRADGRVIIQVPNANSILASRHRYNDYTHHSSFTEHSLNFVLLNAGFARVDIPIEPPMARPSIRLWKSNARKYLIKWLVTKFWKVVLEAELGAFGEVDKIPVGLNMMAIAYK